MRTLLRRAARVALCLAATLLVGAAAAQESTLAPSADASTVPAAPASAAPTVAGSAATASAKSATPRGTSAPAKGNALNIALPASGADGQTALALRVVIGLTLLAVLPSLLICCTAFLRIIVVLSMLRQAIGMPETPPNPVLIGLALFLTLFTMQPVFQSVGHDAIEPFMAARIDATAAYANASKPLRDFMIRQTREHDLALMVELSKAPQPRTIDDVGMVQLAPAFILSELRAAFQIGFVIFLPFLLIDLIVSSILMALGMMMMPPVTVSLPLKILMFVLVDGWSLVLKALVGSFH
jgi:flagellar biosynthetic protein FliP